MKNKMIIFLLATIMIVSAISGCKSNEEVSTQDEVMELKSYSQPAVEEDAEEESYFSSNDKVTYTQSVAGEGGEEYGEFSESPFYSPLEMPLSTFSIDVDTASYSNIRRMLNDGYLPEADAVRVEECINYFSYDYDTPNNDDPYAINIEMAVCPWESENYLVKVALAARDIDSVERVPSNLVFLIDVSGSMNSADKIALARTGFKMLVDSLTEDDIISIVTYSGNVEVLLEGVSGDNDSKIDSALDRLKAKGATAGGAAMEMAYEIAQENFIEGGNNLIIMATDGDFNVGISSESDLEDFIEDKRDEGVFLSILGFGTGNIKDNKMELLADKGNGNYSYIDSASEANKVLVVEMSSTLYTIAKDVKIQVEFNPQNVAAYRLVGYDNRRLNAEDFNDDKKDAGEMGLGHTVTVFYEVVPQGASPGIDPLRYSDNDLDDDWSGELDFEWMYVKTKYKHPEDTVSQRNIEVAVTDDHITNNPSDDFLFASAVAEFALILKDSEYCDGDIDDVIDRAQDARGDDDDGYRAEFVRLAKVARSLLD